MTLPKCAEGLRNQQEEMALERTECAALRWDYSPQTIQRALLCAFDLHVPKSTPKRMHLYVHIDEIGDANNDESLRCFLEEGYGVDVTLLYHRPKQLRASIGKGLRPLTMEDAMWTDPTSMFKSMFNDAKTALATVRANIPQSLPKVAGVEPMRSLVVVDVTTQSTDELAVAETIRFNEERTEIRDVEFWFMLNLQELPPHMPSLTKIGKYAFMNCIELRALGRMNKLETIGKAAFQDCIRLTNLGVMTSLHTIREMAFRNCTGLTDVGELKSLRMIGRSAFGKCTKLTKLGDMNALKAIGLSAFETCTKLTELGQMGALETIHEAAFIGCTGLVALPELPSLERILSYAFKGCTNLKSMHLGAKLQFINTGAFYECPRLENIYADYDARENVLICVDKTASRIIHKAYPNHKLIIHVEDIPNPHTDGWARAYAKCALNSRWVEPDPNGSQYANLEVTDAYGIMDLHNGETVASWLKRSSKNRVFLRETDEFTEAIAHFVSDVPGDGGILDAHQEKTCLHVQCGRAYGSRDSPGSVRHGDIDMSRWFWMVASSSMATIFVPVAGVLSPPSPFLKLGNVAENQSVALLAAVPVVPRYNIFNESINVENYMRLCKSKDYLSTELIPLSVVLSASMDSFGISWRKWHD